MINSVIQQSQSTYTSQPESQGDHFHFAMELASTMDRLPSDQAWILKARISAVMAEFVAGQESAPLASPATTAATHVLRDSIHY